MFQFGLKGVLHYRLPLDSDCVSRDESNYDMHPLLLFHFGGRMRSALPWITTSILLLASNACLAGYADDRAEIENLSNKYMVALDAGDIETVMSTWVDDGVLDWFGGVEHGKVAIRTAMSKFANRLHGDSPEGATWRPRTRHQIINHVIDVNGNTAKTTAYWFAMTNQTPQHDVQLFYFGHYEDELVKVQGHWLFKKRKVYNESQPNRALYYPALGEKNPQQK